MLFSMKIIFSIITLLEQLIQIIFLSHFQPTTLKIMMTFKPLSPLTLLTPIHPLTLLLPPNLLLLQIPMSLNLDDPPALENLPNTFKIFKPIVSPNTSSTTTLTIIFYASLSNILFLLYPLLTILAATLKLLNTIIGFKL